MTMNAFAELLINHGVVVLFILVLAGQAGLPVPSVPMLLAVGSLASLGRMNPTASIGVALIACLMADVFWYEVGRRGCSNLLRKRAWRPRRSKERMGSIMAALKQHWLGVLFVAKFLPGPNLVSPLAGRSGLSRSRFLIFDSIASIVWAGGYITAGYIFGGQLARVTAYGSQLGVALLLLLASPLVTAAVVRSIRCRWPQLRQWKRVKNPSRRSAPAHPELSVAFGTDGMGDSRGQSAEKSVGSGLMEPMTVSTR